MKKGSHRSRTDCCVKDEWDGTELCIANMYAWIILVTDDLFSCVAGLASNDHMIQALLLSPPFALVITPTLVVNLFLVVFLYLVIFFWL